MRLLIGYDGSESANAALSDLRRAGLPRDTEALILSRILPAAAELIKGVNYDAAFAARMMVEWAENELSVIGLRTSVVFGKGEPERVLVDEARKWGADSIFVGSRNFNSAFERLRLGSVSTALVTSAPCSVEVVR